MAPPPPPIKQGRATPPAPPAAPSGPKAGSRTTSISSPRKKVGWLGSVQEELTELRSRCIVLCGASGLGKTSFAAQFPKPLFLMDDQETGLLDLMQRPGLIPKGVGHGAPVSHWKQLLDSLDELIGYGGPNAVGYKTLVLESITGFEKFMFNYAIQKDWQGNVDRFMDYAKGPKQAAKRYWSEELLARLTVLRNQSWHVCLTAHSQVNSKDNTEGADFSAEIPFCDKQTWQNTHRWAECAIMMALVPVLESKNSIKAKANTEGHRFIYASTSPVYAAKNRWNLNGVININEGSEKGYKSFCSWAGLDPKTLMFV